MSRRCVYLQLLYHMICKDWKKKSSIKLKSIFYYQEKYSWMNIALLNETICFLKFKYQNYILIIKLSLHITEIKSKNKKITIKC